MLDDHDRRPGRQVPDQPGKLGEFGLGEPAGGLVEQEQPRAGGERAGQGDPFAHPVGKLIGHPFREVGRPDVVERLERVLPQRRLVPVRAGQAEQRGAEPGAGSAGRAGHDVLEHGQAAEQGHALQGPRDAGPASRCGRSRRSGLPSKEMLPACGLTKPQSTLSRVVLPGPVRADHAGHLARRDGERYLVEGGEAAKAHRHTAHIEGPGPRSQALLSSAVFPARSAELSFISQIPGSSGVRPSSMNRHSHLSGACTQDRAASRRRFVPKSRPPRRKHHETPAPRARYPAVTTIRTRNAASTARTGNAAP